MLSSGAAAKRIVAHPCVASTQLKPCPTGNYLSLVIYNIRASTVCCEIRILRESWCAGLVNRFQRLGAVQARGVAARLVTTRVNEKEGNETERT